MPGQRGADLWWVSASQIRTVLSSPPETSAAIRADRHTARAGRWDDFDGALARDYRIQQRTDVGRGCDLGGQDLLDGPHIAPGSAPASMAWPCDVSFNRWRRGVRALARCLAWAWPERTRHAMRRRRA